MHDEYGFTIILDMQGSSQVPDPDRPIVRDRIYQAAERAFVNAGISSARMAQEDRGDGIIAVVEPRCTERIVGEWVEYLHQNLRETNRGPGWPLRLRVGLNVGPVRTDPHGFSGSAVDFASRIANCTEAKTVLAAASASPLLVAVSDRLYQDVIRHGGRWIDPAHYRQFDVALQEGWDRPWFMVPGLSEPPRASSVAGPMTEAPQDTQTAGRGEEPQARAGGMSFDNFTFNDNSSGYLGHFGDITVDNRHGGQG